jgi:hypothetical protein
MSRVSQAIRQQVSQRANQRCEYCRKPEGVSQYSHHVDHIIALRHGGTSSLDNLAWACFQCNSTKTTDIASYDSETKQLTPLYNPRNQEWDDHFVVRGSVIEGKTPVGRVTTVRILQMNHPDQVETREHLIKAKRW